MGDKIKSTKVLKTVLVHKIIQTRQVYFVYKAKLWLSLKPLVLLNETVKRVIVIKLAFAHFNFSR